MVPPAPPDAVRVAEPQEPLDDTVTIAGDGLTVTVKVKVLPWHPPSIGVTTYVAVTGFEVILVRVPLIEDWGVGCAAPPVNPLPVGASQV